MVGNPQAYPTPYIHTEPLAPVRQSLDVLEAPKKKMLNLYFSQSAYHIYPSN